MNWTGINWNSLNWNADYWDDESNSVYGTTTMDPASNSWMIEGDNTTDKEEGERHESNRLFLPFVTR